jgi:hypothetical protein
VLKQEWEYFLAHRAEWLEKAAGRYVLIHGEEAVGFYDAFSQAVDDGYRRLGHVPFLVRRLILEQSPIHLWTGDTVSLLEFQQPSLDAEGPVVRLKLSPCRSAQEARRRMGKTIHTPIEVDALIDTGASHSVLQDNLLEPLGVLPVGLVLLNTTIDESVRCYEFFLQAELGPLRFAAVFLGAPLPASHFQAIIGRDVLDNFTMLYDGPNKRFTLTLNDGRENK